MMKLHVLPWPEGVKPFVIMDRGQSSASLLAEIPRQFIGHSGRAPNSTLMPALRAIAADVGVPVFAMDAGIGVDNLMRRAAAQISLDNDARVYQRALPFAEAFDRIDAALESAMISRGAANRKTKRLRRRVINQST